MAQPPDDGDAEIRSYYEELINSLYRRGRPEAARDVAALAVEQRLWTDPLQRPVDYEPTGGHEPVYDPTSFWFTALLREAYPRIRSEIDSVLPRGSEGFAPVEEPLVDRGRWDQVILYDAGRRQEEACARFPVTASVVEQIPEATTMGPGVVTLSWLAPGTHLVPHCGQSNAQLRVHLGVRVPPGPVMRVGDRQLTWADGECLVFDDSFEHEVHHNGASPRLVLLLDVPHPGLDERARRRALARKRTPSAQIAAFMAGHGVRRIETDGTDIVMRPGIGTDSLIRRYLEVTGTGGVELDEDQRLRFD